MGLGAGEQAQTPAADTIAAADTTAAGPPAVFVAVPRIAERKVRGLNYSRFG